MALPTHGRVLLDTTAGDIDIELWSKEAPKACRNFIALAMEGYYDGVIFHRVVPDFLVQTGDRTGSGSGGESFFGEPFEDEVHPRLRFAHRGLVGMANNGSKNSNDSQFFITLDRADELHGKHTLFGRCVGDTIYNVMKIGAMELDNGRPVYPPKIKTVRIIENPFDDIVPRITAEEKRVQQRARQAAIREREEVARRKGAKKDTKLLSFGADADEEAEGVSAVLKKKSVARPDLVENLDQQSTPMLDRFPSKSEKATRGESKRDSDTLTTKPSGEDLDLSKIREAHQKEKAASSSARQTEIERMEAEVKRLARQRDGGDSDEERNVKKAKKRSQLDEELAKYQKGRGVHRKKGQNKDESNVLAVLSGFRSKLQTSVTAQDEKADRELGDAPGDVGEQAIEGGTAGIELDNDRGFMGHSLHFPKGNEEEVQKAEREYEVIDPRVRSAQARQEERDRKHATRTGKGPVRHGRR